MTPGPAVCHHCHTCKLHTETPAPVEGDGGGWRGVEGVGGPNICPMINLSMSLWIRGGRSSTLYYLNTSPSQGKCSPLTNRLLDSSVKWQRSLLFTFVASIHHRPALAHVPVIIFLRRDIAPGQNICSAGGIFLPLSLLWQTKTSLWSFCHNSALACRIFVRVDSVYMKLLFVSGLNYSGFNCFQIKSQGWCYPATQPWQPDQCGTVIVTAAKSHFT